jgi:alpha/beta superfamily hydrolase
MIALQHAEDDPSLRALVLRGPVCNMDSVHASAVQTPTLLIHAEQDTALVDAVQTLDRDLAARHKLVRIASTNRLFGDAAGMDRMVNATVEWLVEQLFDEMPLASPDLDGGNGHVGPSRAQASPV